MDLASASWRKSTRSGYSGCVEVAFLEQGHIAVRDAKDRQGPVLMFDPVEWRAFIRGVHDGEFDLPTTAQRWAPT